MKILITGVSRGLGYALAKNALSDGLIVLGLVRDLNNIAVDTLVGLGMLAIIGDMSSPKSIKNLINYLVTMNLIPNIVILNAAVQESDIDIFLNNDQFIKIMNINLINQLLLISDLLPHLVLINGRVIVISSLSARIATDPKRVAYPASKAGLSMALSALRLNSNLKSIKFITVEAGSMKIRSDFFSVTYEWAANRILRLINDTNVPTKIVFPFSSLILFNLLNFFPSQLIEYIVRKFFRK